MTRKEQAIKEYKKYEMIINELKKELEKMEKNGEPWEKQSKIWCEIKMYRSFQGSVEHLSGCYHLDKEL